MTHRLDQLTVLGLVEVMVAQEKLSVFTLGTIYGWCVYVGWGEIHEIELN